MFLATFLFLFQIYSSGKSEVHAVNDLSFGVHSNQVNIISISQHSLLRWSEKYNMLVLKINRDGNYMFNLPILNL